MSSYTRYFRLVKPSIDEPYDIGVFNSNLDKIDKELGERVASDPFVSEDEDDPEELATMPEVMTDGDDRSTLFNKLSVVVKNVRYLIKLIGDTDISAIGDGSITGAIDGVNEDLQTQVATINEDLSNKVNEWSSTLYTSNQTVSIPNTAKEIRLTMVKNMSSNYIPQNSVSIMIEMLTNGNIQQLISLEDNTKYAKLEYLNGTYTLTLTNIYGAIVDYR